jgi:hypothetical protein
MFLSGCEKIIRPEIATDPRQYIWIIDTISYPGSDQTLHENIWGSSPKDVYSVGHCDLTKGTMYHYNGKSWENVKLSWSQGGTLEGGMELEDITGFGPNDVWAVGERIGFVDAPGGGSKIEHAELLIHYDGKTWKEIKLDGNVWNLHIWGNSPDNIYVSGFGKNIWNYNGSVWKKDTLPMNLPVTQSNFQNQICGDKIGNLYVLGYSNCNFPYNETRYFFIKKNDQWILKETYTSKEGSFDSAYVFIRFWVSPEGNLFCAGGYGILKWSGEKWETFYDIGGLYSVFFNIYGVSENNIFAVGTGGKVYHYNGSNWHQFGQFSDFDVLYTGIWTEGTEVFIVGHTYSTQKTIILHGSQKGGIYGRKK